MKTNHLNEVINSFIVIAESTARLSPEKGMVSRKDKLETAMPYVMLVQVKGDIDGTLAIGVEENTIMALATQTKNNDEIFKEFSMEVINEATGFLGKIGSNLVTRMKENGYELGIERADFVMNNELPEDNSTYLVVEAETHIGNFELNMKIKKN